MFKTNILCINSKYYIRNFNLDVILKVVSRSICFWEIVQKFCHILLKYEYIRKFKDLPKLQLSWYQTDFRFKHFCLVVQKLPKFTDTFPWITSRSKPHSFDIRIISKTFMSTQLFMPLSKMLEMSALTIALQYSSFNRYFVISLIALCLPVCLRHHST